MYDLDVTVHVKKPNGGKFSRTVQENSYDTKEEAVFCRNFLSQKFAEAYAALGPAFEEFKAKK